MGIEYQKDINIRTISNISVEPLLFDTFEDLLNWSEDDYENDSRSFALHTTKSYQGGQSLKISTGDTAPATNDFISIIRGSAEGPQKYLEVIGFYNPESNYANQKFLLRGDALRGGNNMPFGVGINMNTKQGLYIDDGGDWANLPNGADIPMAGEWNYIRLVIDLDTSKYVSATFNHQKIDMSTLSILEESGNAGSGVLWTLYIETLSDAEATCLLDNFIARMLDNP